MVHPLIEKVRTFSEEHTLLPKGSSLIVGLSGGPDSMALVSLLKALEPDYAYKLVVAHLDHQWRPNSAQEDRKSVV